MIPIFDVFSNYSTGQLKSGEYRDIVQPRGDVLYSTRSKLYPNIIHPSN